MCHKVKLTKEREMEFQNSAASFGKPPWEDSIWEKLEGKRV